MPAFGGERRRFGRAARLRVRAAGAKAAARRRVDRARHVALQYHPLRRARRARAPESPRAAPACTGGAAARTARALAAYSTMRPRYMTATRAAMCLTTARSCAMNTYGEPEALLQVHQQVDHLRLDRYVERRHRLVADDQPRLDGERARDADPLPLAAGELVRIALGVLRRQADQAEQLGDAIAAPAGRETVQRQRLADGLRDRHARIERRVRVLEDDLQRAPLRAHRARRRARTAPAPSKRTLPAVGSIRRSSSRPVVDLPQPDSPTSASVSPAASSKSMPSTARTTRASRARRSPCAAGNA